MSEEPKKLTIEPIFPLKGNRNINHIIVIGCGGTGGYFVRDIARSISTMSNSKSIVLTLIDGDNVEDKNLKRQNFIHSDIARNKAEVLASRYSTLGIKTAYQARFLEKSADLTALINEVPGSSLVVSCVDNVKTRALVRDAVRVPYPGYPIYWIDCGNEEFSGQVVLGINYGQATFTPDHIRAGTYCIPDVFHLYPELEERAKQDKLPTELSCAELAASSPQYGFVNATAAILAVNFAHDLLSSRELKTHAVSFTTDNKFNHKSLTLSNLLSWKKMGEPFASGKLDPLTKRKPTLT